MSFGQKQKVSPSHNELTLFVLRSGLARHTSNSSGYMPGHSDLSKKCKAMIQIRCNACKRLAFEASEDATGVFKTRCQRSSCGRLFTVTLPIGNKGEGEAAGVRRASKEGETLVELSETRNVH